MTHSNAKINRLTPTNEDTLGPYYPISLCDNDSMDMTEIRRGIILEPRGEKIVIEGCIKDINGNLANGCLLEFWQANADGVYRTPLTETHPKLDPWFNGYARHRTKDGNFSLKTIRPGVNTDLDHPRAPNITLTIFSDGIMRVVTQLFFDGDPANENDPLLLSIDKNLRERLLMKPAGETDNGLKIYKIDIIMAGDNETPFFDDLLS
ncbi:MAG: hypothetical protein KDF58_01380 [Alphaproteobacteria bacterium]|nr:hypothetical protein [Alphaproteobacteria bacterium]HPF47127.1 hypothetical protein [Emcibacteraceae bacterium]HRW28589.1 hypothetical protein [Emcibacteraceae bacterium]